MPEMTLWGWKGKEFGSRNALGHVYDPCFPHRPDRLQHVLKVALNLARLETGRPGPAFFNLCDAGSTAAGALFPNRG